MGELYNNTLQTSAMYSLCGKYRYPRTSTRVDHRREKGREVGGVYLPSQLERTPQPVLRIRIRDPVPFRPLDRGSGMGKKNQDPDTE